MLCRFIPLLLLPISLLAACQAEKSPQSFLPDPSALQSLSLTPTPTQTPSPARALSTPTATESPTLTRTLYLPNTPRAPQTEPVEEIGSISNAALMRTRAAEGERMRQFYPTPAGGPALTPLPAGSPQPYQDCRRTPGLVNCDPSAPLVDGRLAFYDTEKGALVFTDLKTGQSWQVTAPKPQFISWSPDGSRLLARFPTDLKEGTFRSYAVYTLQGALVKQSSKEEVVSWQETGATLETYPAPSPVIRSEQGDEAWLENTADYTHILHVRIAGEALWKSFHLKVSPWESNYTLYRWVPSSHNLIIERSGHSVQNYLSHGEDFLLFNADTGDLSYLFVNGHLKQGWAEFKGSLLAFIQLDWGMDNRLGILDGRTGKATFPLPPMSEFNHLTVRELTWHPSDSPDGSSLIFSVDNTNRLNEPVRTQFPTDGLYIYNLPSHSYNNLVKTADGWIAGNIHWAADGQFMLYSTGPKEPSEKGQTSLLLRRMSDGKEWTLVNGLSGPDVFISEVGWNMAALYFPVP